MAPFKSEAQRRKFKQLEKEGKISSETIAKWEEETPASIPERAPSPVGGIIRAPRKARYQRPVRSPRK